MILSFRAFQSRLRTLALPLVATLAGAALSPASADQKSPDAAQTVRTTLIALSAADAAMTLADASPASTEIAANLAKPATAPALENASFNGNLNANLNAMAAVRAAPARRVASAGGVDRRVAYRPSRDPFFLAIGIAY